MEERSALRDLKSAKRTLLTGEVIPSRSTSWILELKGIKEKSISVCKIH